MVKISIVESDKEIMSRIYKAYGKELQKHFNSVSGRLLKNIEPAVVASLATSPEILSLSSGVLKADFGLTSDPSKSIIDAVVASMRLTTKKVVVSGNKINGGFELNIQPSSYSNLLSLSVSKQAIEGGGSLPWLEWLLTLGDAVIIANFGVEYGPFGRTGRARMTEDTRPFKVNSAFSGTSGDNFITRALSRSKKYIVNTIIKAIQ